MKLEINDSLTEELSLLDCVKAHLPQRLDEKGDIIQVFDEDGQLVAPVYTLAEKEAAIAGFVYAELKSRLVQRREETASKVAVAAVDKAISVKASIKEVPK